MLHHLPSPQSILRPLRNLGLALCVLLPGAALPAGAQSTQDLQNACIDPLFCPQTPAAVPTQPNYGLTAPYSNPSVPSATDQNRDLGQSRENETGLYVDSAGNLTSRAGDEANKNNPYRTTLFPPDPITDMQRLAHASTGELLPVFGRDLFRQAPSTFAPGDQIPVTPSYIVGPGDDILLRLWGPESFNSQLTVDRSGSVYIPKVGAVHVAGLRFDQLQAQITSELSRSYRNFQISVNLGRLRSIQVYVVGEARRPGAYTISSLSTVLNALFASGGPDVQGSLRHIQVRRGGLTLGEFDLYDLVLRGDKSRDIPLETGDTIFIPPVGPQVAVAGSVRHPAIYELRGETTVAQMLALAGGLAPTAATGQISLERIEGNQRRHAMSVALNAAGGALPLRDGDVLYAGHISPGYEQSVTLRGNLANPGRFAWHPGMRLSEILPDRQSLLTNGYWRERNRLGLPVPLFQPLEDNNRRYLPNGLRRGVNGRVYENNTQLPAADQPLASSQFDQNPYAAGAGLQRPYVAENQTANSSLFDAGALAAQQQQQPQQQQQQDPSQYGVNQSGNSMASPGTLTETQERRRQPNEVGPPAGPRNRIQIPAPEIDWSYAVIERLDPDTLKSTLVPFKLGRLVLDHDPAQDLELHAGDVVTILSQNDVTVPTDEQTKYIRLEGEFVTAGVYSVTPNETLKQLVERAGGLTGKAYLYGSSFERESARVFQQQRLDEYIATLSADMERAAAVRTASSTSGIADPTALAEQRNLISQLRQLRATGRVVLEFGPESAGTGSIPPIPLENGDVFRVPTRPNTISVVGAVYGQNVFLYSPQRKLADYVALAGKPNRIADAKHAFIIRADGSIYSRERAGGVFFSNSFNDARIHPGDSIVIPEKLIKPTALRQLLDFSQILSSFGLAAAAINVVR